MVGRGAKGGEGMGRAAAADVLGGWEGMVPASPDHAPPRAPFTPQRVVTRTLHPSSERHERHGQPRMHAGDGIG